MQYQQQQQQTPPLTVALSSNSTPTPSQNGGAATEAPPKQVALAMERLVQAGRLIADIRLGADRLLEALFVSTHPYQSDEHIELFVKEDASMRQHLQDLRSIGRQLEDSGVLNESLRSRSNSWGLHMPLVCPDGAVVAYAWKRQLAGQAGASAVDRTRLALKAFTDQKRRFFPHLDDAPCVENSDPASKKRKHESMSPMAKDEEELADCQTLTDILTHLEKEVPDMKVSTYQRLDWLKKASSLPSSSDKNVIGAPEEPSFHCSSRIRTGQVSNITEDKVAVVELLCPSIFRAVVSLHPAGSTDPDAVAFFSPDEGGSYVHARGSSVHHVFRFITEHAAMALQYFLGSKPETALYYLLHWVCSYRSVYTNRCSKCRRLLAIDKQSSLLLPPVQRPYRQFSVANICSTQSNSSSKDQNLCDNKAYHIGCFLEESKSSL